jgi:hypothetical protein
MSLDRSRCAAADTASALFHHHRLHPLFYHRLPHDVYVSVSVYVSVYVYVYVYVPCTDTSGKKKE